MQFYLTTKGSWTSDNCTILYLGTTLDEAREIIPHVFRGNKIEKRHYPTKFPYLFAAIPERLHRKMEEFYDGNGWWVSIVSIEVETTNP